MKQKLSAYLFLTAFAIVCFSLKTTAIEPIKVLLLSGRNNHEWKQTTPKLQEILTQSKFFTVSITESPDTISEKFLKQFQLILSNWNSWPELKCSWSEATKNALLNFVRAGNGIAFVHAAGSANYDWPEFQQMGAAAWGDSTKHGKVAAFELKFTDSDCPVTKGLANFRTTDELWVDSRISGKHRVLAEAFASPDNSGSGEMEPILFCGNFGKGRTFTTLLGHDANSMKNLGFQTLLLRGCEWAATGKVTQKISDELSLTATSRELNWRQEKNSVALMNNDKTVWQHHFDKVEGKPYFHPLSTMDGSVLTAMRPEDHPWHRAVWFSWKFINGLNYWEEDRETGKSEGITELKSVASKLNKDFTAEFKIELAYHPPMGVDLLNEERTIRMSPPAEDGSYFMDWESTFTALANEVVLDRTPLPDEPNGVTWGGYAGFSARLNLQLWDVKTISDSGETENLHGKASKWISFQAKNLKGEPVSLTIFDHPDNVKFPNKFYISNDPVTPFYYFSPALIFDQRMILKKGEKLHLKYRLLIYSGELNQEKINSNWNQFKTK